MKTDVFFNSVTDSIVSALKQGVPPWQKSWTSAGLPTNAISKKPYSGVNLFSLWNQKAPHNYWVTFKQAQNLGGSVKKGSKGCPVIYASRGSKIVETDNETVEKAFSFVKVYYVFNIADTEGIDWSSLISAQNINPDQRDARTDADITLTHATIYETDSNPCYIPKVDEIHMPKFEHFKGSDHYYATLFHELGHWTGHESRLNRQLSGRFGSQAYAAEELIAEFASAFLCAHYGYKSPEIRHASYIESWIKLLADNNKAIMTAASAASKATNYILGQNLS